MRECHARQRQLVVGSLVHLLRKAVRPPDNKTKVAAHAVGLAGYIVGILTRTELASAFVEQNQAVGRPYNL